jgi:hypothetical protein
MAMAIMKSVICNLLDHIHGVVVTQPIAGGPVAGGFARVSPKPWHAKR